MVFIIIMTVLFGVFVNDADAAPQEPATKYCGCYTYWINSRYQMMCVSRSSDPWWLFYHFWWRGSYWGTAAKIWVAAPKESVPLGYGWTGNVTKSACPVVWRGP